jgi:hypothetical protein
MVSGTLAEPGNLRKKPLNNGELNMLNRIVALVIVAFVLSIGTVNAEINDNLVAYYPFEGNSDDVINDYHGIDEGEVAYVEGAVGQSATFNGNGYIEVPAFPGLETWTISFWIYVDEMPPKYWYSVVGKMADIWEGTAGNYNWVFAMYRNNWFDVQYESCVGDNKDYMMHPGQPFYAKKWYHVASTRDSDGNFKIYLNGKLGNQQTLADLPCANDESLIIGGQTTSYAFPFKGAVDELRIYGVAKTAEEILEISEEGEWVAQAIEPESINIDVTPKKLNAKSKEKRAVLPVTILTGDNYDLSEIDIASIKLEGVAPSRSSINKNKIDLKFSLLDIISALGDVTNGDTIILKMTGALTDDTSFIGEDQVIIKK